MRCNLVVSKNDARLIYPILSMFVLLVVICFTGCTDELGSSSPQKATPLFYSHSTSFGSSTSFPDNALYVMSGTYDTSSNTATNIKSCSIFGDNLKYIQIINPSAKLDFSQEVSAQSVKSAIGLDLTAQFKAGFIKVKISKSYAKTSQDDSFRTNLNYIYKYSGNAVFKPQIDLQGESVLTAEALKALHTDSNRFRELCGDTMITQLDAGVAVLMRITLEFKSHSEKKVFDSSSIETVGLQSVLAKLREKNKGVNFSVSASGLQLGGDSNKFNQLFLSHSGKIGDDGFPMLECSGSGLDDSTCVELVDQVITYAQTIQSQIQTPADLYYSAPVL